MQRTPDQIGFRSPIELIVGPLAGVVPRALWPGKPIPLTGLQVTQEFYETSEYSRPMTRLSADSTGMADGFLCSQACSWSGAQFA